MSRPRGNLGLVPKGCLKDLRLGLGAGGILLCHRDPGPEEGAADCSIRRPRRCRRGIWRRRRRSPGQGRSRCRRRCRRDPGRGRSGRRSARASRPGSQGRRRRLRRSPRRPARSSRSSIVERSGVCWAALSSRLRTIRWSSSALPSTRSGRSLSISQNAAAHQRRRLGGGVAGDFGEVATAVLVEPAGVGAGEQQKVADEPGHPPRGAERRIDHLEVLRMGSVLERGLQQFEVGEDTGQRRPQLVRGVGDELALQSASPPRARSAPRPGSAASPPRSGSVRRPRLRPRARASAARGRGWWRSGARSRSASRSAASLGRRSRPRRRSPAGCRRGSRRGSRARPGRWWRRRGRCCARTARSRRISPPELMIAVATRIPR